MNKIEETLALLRGDPVSQEYFFTKAMLEVSKPTKWLAALHDAGYFSPDKHPIPEPVPEDPGRTYIRRWFVLPYLEKVATLNLDDPDPEVTARLISIVDEIVSNATTRNWFTDATLMHVIARLPLDTVNEKTIENVRVLLESGHDAGLMAKEITDVLFPRLIKAKDSSLVLSFLYVVLGFRVTTKGLTECESVLDNHWLSEFLEKNQAGIAGLCSLEAARVGVKRIRELTTVDESLLTAIRVPTIEDHEQTDRRHYFAVILVQFARDMYQQVDVGDLRGDVERLVLESEPILRRLGIHLINRFYSEFKSCFWAFEEAPWSDWNLHHEVHVLLEQHAKELTYEEITRFLLWLDSWNYPKKLEIEGSKKAAAYRRKQWLIALMNSADERIHRRLAEIELTIPNEVDHPAFLSWSSGVTRRSVTPDPTNEFDGKTVEEIAKILAETTFENVADPWEHPAENVAATLRAAVKSASITFLSKQDLFVNQLPIYQEALIHGFFDQWKSEMDSPLQEFLNYCHQLFSNDHFWTVADIGRYEHRGASIKLFMDVLAEIIRDPAKKIPDEVLDLIENNLTLLANRAPSSVKEEYRNICDAVLNSPRGRVYDGMLDYAIYCGRQSKSPYDSPRVRRILENFANRLDNYNIEPIDLYEVLGRSLPRLLFLSGDWLTGHVDKIFPPERPTQWKVAMTAHLFHLSGVYEQLYSMLASKNHLSKAILTNFADDYVRDKLIQLICVGFFEDYEDINSETSLIYGVLEAATPKDLSQLIWFASKPESWKIPGRRKKLKLLWENLHRILSEHSGNSEFDELASRLGRWLNDVDTLDSDIYEWAKLSARAIPRRFDGYEFIEALHKHVDSHTLWVGELLYEMIKGNEYPDYREDMFKEILAKLFDTGNERLGRRIWDAAWKIRPNARALNSIHKQYISATS